MYIYVLYSLHCNISQLVITTKNCQIRPVKHIHCAIQQQLCYLTMLNYALF